MPESETSQEPDEAHGNLQVPGFYVGPQSNDMRNLWCRSFSFSFIYEQQFCYTIRDQPIAVTPYNHARISI